MPYGILVRLFVDGRITAEEFEVIFLRLYKADPTSWSGEVFDVLDRLFGDVDAFSGDERLRAATDGIDAGELRHRATVAFRELERLAS